MSLDTGTRLRQILRLAGTPDDKHRLAEQDIHGLTIAPEALRAALAAGHTGRVHVTGTLDRRLVPMERNDGRWVIEDLSGQPHETRTWPDWIDGHVKLDDATSWIALGDVDEHAAYRFTRPRVLLTALYHPEHFPLPRFPGWGGGAAGPFATFHFKPLRETSTFRNPPIGQALGGRA